jgi:Na+-translocating ferredoxin:NAD+ oxidoreductase subunit B
MSVAMSVIAALLVMVALATMAALAIGLSAARSAGARDESTLIDRIDALLPQTQCGRCTFAGCRPYAAALARGEADINQCPPGGEQTMLRLARLLGRMPRLVDERFGIVPASPHVAWIDEPRCIGCTKCIQACPVDAIVGASKYMHTVIAADCTGCELCIPPCPVDCIEMRPAPPAGAHSRRRAFAPTAAALVE